MTKITALALILLALLSLSGCKSKSQRTADEILRSVQNTQITVDQDALNEIQGAMKRTLGD